MLSITSQLLVVLGILLLAYSLYPINLICKTRRKSNAGWRMLFALVLFFIFGYIGYVVALITTPVRVVELVVALILFGGSWFVMIVTGMSLRSIQDIQKVAASERHHALHDSLTNLPNRNLLLDRLEQAISLAQRIDQPISTLVIDLDRFKEVNDTLGHHYGDQLLQLVAPRIRSVLRDVDTVARLGGDEFAIVLPNTTISGAAVLCEKLLNVMEQPFIVEGHRLSVGMSIGIAAFPEHGSDKDILLQRADVAMYVAKRGGSGYEVYDVSQDQHSLERLTMSAQLRDAIKDSTLEMHYQPIVHLASGDLWGVEALVRWPRTGLNAVTAREFVRLAEQTGVIKSLTDWILRQAMHDAEICANAGYPLQVSVNLSKNDIQDKDFPKRLARLTESNPAVIKRIAFEITENSMLTKYSQAYEVLTQIHGQGAQVSIDDFGTGFSSLANLKQLPASRIKIDRSFVEGMLTDDNDAIIVRSTIDLAHNMGLEVVAEGVASKDAFDLLEILGCDFAQGFHICPPKPLRELLNWLDLRNKTDDVPVVGLTR